MIFSEQMIFRSGAGAAFAVALLSAVSAAAVGPQWLADNLPRQFEGTLKLSSDRPGDVIFVIHATSVDSGKVALEARADVVKNTYRIDLDGYIDPDTLRVDICPVASDEPYPLLSECLVGRVSDDLATIKARKGTGASRVLLNVTAK